MNNVALKPYYVASVSGGKDSLYMLMLILSNPVKYPLDLVIYLDLETDYPFIKKVVDFMEDKLKNYGIKLLRLKPTCSWETLYNKYGYPSYKVRWCNSQYKLTGLKKLQDYCNNMKYELFQYIGFCADEIRRFKKDNHYIYPLAIENINESYILDWAKTEPIFNGYYIYNKRCGCMGCPLASLNEWRWLRSNYPKEYNYYLAKLKKCKYSRLEYYYYYKKVGGFVK